MKKSILQDKSFDFAVRIVKLVKHLRENKNEYVLSKQLLRSGTSIGASQREGCCAESRQDFIHKFAIAQKECNETLYWLELLYSTEYMSKVEYDSMIHDAEELIKLLTSSIKTAKHSLTINH